MTFSRIGRIVKGLVASAALGLGMTACGGGTVGFMWVVGQQTTSTTNTGIITGFKIDDYTGNLTTIPGSPFGAGGASPAYLVIKQGGRFVYVINKAVGSTPGNVSVFSVGGDGSLLFQLSYGTQGNNPIWATFDSTGTYLYVLDQTAPSTAYCPTGFPTGCADITAFSVAGDSGRLTLVQNNAIHVGSTQVPINYFPIAPGATMLAKATSGCIYSLSPTLLYPLSSGTGGQLSTPSTGALQFPGANLTSINATGSYVYLTDSVANVIYPLTASGTACSLTTLNPGIVSNIGGTSLPVNSLTTTNNHFLYTINQSNLSNPQAAANSNISAFTIDSATGRLQELSDPPNNPYSVGSGPTCMVEDTSSQYIYTTDSVSNTVTGKVLNQNTGQLSPLTRGSTFTLAGKPACLAISGNVD